MAESRLNKSMKNTVIGMIATMMNLLFQFAARSVFVRVLGEAFNGVNGLFTSILQVLNLAELGFASAIAFSLYKPLKENDHETAAEYMNYFAFIYRIIAIVVTVAGLICIPFLQYLIADDWTELPFSINQLRMYFAFYLANTVCSYLLAYKRTIISADQKLFIISISDNLSNIILSLFQIVLLLVTKNYIAYLSIMVVRTILNNVVIHIIASKKYPYLHTYRKSKLSRELKKGLFKNINALMLHKVGSVVIFGTISIIISAFISVTSAGIYSNYIIIVNGVNTFINMLFNSIVASIGDLCVDADDEKKYMIFRRVDFMGRWVSVFCMVCYVNIFNTFMDNIWLGEGHTFGFITVVAISFSAYVTYSRKSVSIFKDAMGLFKKDWYKPLLEAGLGIVLAIGLSYVWGVLGVVIGYTIASFIIAMPIEAYVTFKYGMNKNFIPYMGMQYLKSLFAIGLSVGLYYLCGLFGLTGVADFVVRALVSIIASNVILFLFNIKNDNLKFYLNLLKKIFAKIGTKLKGKKAAKAVAVAESAEQAVLFERVEGEEGGTIQSEPKSTQEDVFEDEESVESNDDDDALENSDKTDKQ